MTNYDETRPPEMGSHAPNVTALKSHHVPHLGMNEDGFLSMMIRHIEERELIDLEGNWMEDVDLIPSEPGERRLGTLTLFESMMFSIAMLAQEIIQDIMIEAQAQTAETAARLLRQQKHNAQGQENPQQNALTEDDRVYLNELSIVFHLSRSAYEFSVRVRLDCFDSLLIVREGFVVYKAANE